MKYLTNITNILGQKLLKHTRSTKELCGFHRSAQLSKS